MANPPAKPKTSPSASAPTSATSDGGLELDTLTAHYYRQYSHFLPPVLLACEAILCTLIILKVPYTEIDWRTYMQQVSMWRGGEWDYSKLRGDTGPLVYPAWHLYIYTVLHWVTKGGEDVFLAQCIFGVVYMATLAVVFACYRRAGAPFWLLGLLVLSKRLHSVFLLRLFNDCWVTLTLWISIYAMQRRSWEVAALVGGLGIGIKMTMLMTGPALLLILIQGQGLADAFFVLTFMAMTQLVSAWPFLYREVGFTYIWTAFDFGRMFEYKWTVNWKFVPEKYFLSREFAVTLLIAHVSLLGLFVVKKWLRPSGFSPLEFVNKYFFSDLKEKEENEIIKRTNATFVMDTMLASVVIGMLCARTLHYQFYAYLGWATPYLLWRSKMPGLLVFILWAVQEFYWNIYPSNEKSSGAVVMLLALQVMTILNAEDEGMPKKTVSQPTIKEAASTSDGTNAEPKADVKETSE